MMRNRPWPLRDILGKLPFYPGIVHCFKGRESPTDSEGYHILVRTAFRAGRLQREAGDTLCKPRLSFEILLDRDDRLITCTACRDIALRLMALESGRGGG